MKNFKIISLGFLMLAVLVPPSSLDASGPAVTMLREQLVVQKRMVRGLMGRLERAEARLRETWIRVQRGGTDFYHAADGGEESSSLASREEDLRGAESELLMGVFETQQLRRSLLDALMMVEELQSEIRRLGGGEGRGDDQLSGRWTITIEPGGLEGEMSLLLDGTLVQGRYELDGGFHGSLRGTLVSGRLRLERLDSQLGFAAIYYGRLKVEGGQPKIEGKWEATQLSSGLPGGGGWVAEKIQDESD